MTEVINPPTREAIEQCECGAPWCTCTPELAAKWDADYHAGTPEQPRFSSENYVKSWEANYKHFLSYKVKGNDVDSQQNK